MASASATAATLVRIAPPRAPCRSRQTTSPAYSAVGTVSAVTASATASTDTTTQHAPKSDLAASETSAPTADGFRATGVASVTAVTEAMLASCLVQRSTGSSVMITEAAARLQLVYATRAVRWAFSLAPRARRVSQDTVEATAERCATRPPRPLLARRALALQVSVVRRAVSSVPVSRYCAAGTEVALTGRAGTARVHVLPTIMAQTAASSARRRYVEKLDL
jgi:hypothetical protein